VIAGFGCKFNRRPRFNAAINAHCEAIWLLGWSTLFANNNGNRIMTENNSEPGIPEKPVKSPMLDQAASLDAVVSRHPEHTQNVSSTSSWRLKRKSKAASPEPSEASLPLPQGQPVGTKIRPARRRVAWYWRAGAGVLLLTVGVGVGFILPDPKNSKEYVTLASEKQGLQSDLEKLQTRYDNLDAGVKGREAKVQAREDAVAKADAAVKTADAAVKAREEAVTAAEKTKAANTIKEGTWTVGVDIEPGTYRVVAEVTSSCYWGIYRTGSNGSDIIDNDIVSGGRPSVMLSPGQDFETTRCGNWTKQ
jgi:hypothetical protein